MIDFIPDYGMVPTQITGRLIEFKHPTTEQMVKFQAPLPEDMQKMLDMLREHRKILPPKKTAGPATPAVILPNQNRTRRP